ncbi:flagellar basal-body MS-ring/collar protein FliF [Vitreimonas flagellata]|uniref:flagellar basal-body MS-ring/collar protein FliF n=1 Tax=Vitreimonas flagellata TaxID=2560861 RepID=UPI00107580E3|nr:flagellar basal-body MS-ring/collar protein FliF [Vitreimonas flagellata]
MDHETTASNQAPSARRAQIMIGVFVLIVGALIAWYWFVLRQDYAPLYSDLRPTQAASIVAALEAEGVDYRVAGGGSEILAPAESIDQLRVELAGAGAPMAGVDGFELFNESDMGLTDFAQKIRYQRAIQGELARTIMMMQGVAEARVHVSIPERTLFRGERRSAEAAVSLLMRPGEDATPERIEGIQRLVAASVQDLAASDVVVLNARGEVISSRVAHTMTSGDNYAAASAGPSLDFIAEIMRLAIPNRRFDVRVEDSPAPLAGADVEDGETPTRRLIVVSTETSLTPDERARVRERLEAAELLNGSSLQLLSFRVEPLTPGAFAPDTGASRLEDPAPDIASDRETNTSDLLQTILALLAALALALGGFFAWRKWRTPNLSFEEQRLLAERLDQRLGAHVGAGDA